MQTYLFYIVNIMGADVLVTQGCVYPDTDYVVAE